MASGRIPPGEDGVERVEREAGIPHAPTETNLRGLWKEGRELAELEAEHRAEIERDEAHIHRHST